MKTLMLTTFTLLIMMSCGQQKEAERLNLEEQKSIALKDPLFLEYFDAAGAKSKLTAESSTLDLEKFQEIIKTKCTASHVCDIDMGIFGGDSEMEQLAGHFCKVTNTYKAVKDKYPFLSQMSVKERADFFGEFNYKVDYDFEKRIEKAKKVHDQQQQKEEKEG